MYLFIGQCGPGGADVLIVLSPNGWQAHHHHDQSQESQSHGHYWSFRLVLTMLFLLTREYLNKKLRKKKKHTDVDT